MESVSVPDCDQIARAVRDVATPIVRALDVELVDVECTGQGARTLVRVFIDKPAGVNLDDCERVHLSLGHALDVHDPIPHAYVLEVSSPGLDRPLKTREAYVRAVGKLITLKLRQPIKGQWRMTGRLGAVHDHGLTLSDVKGQEREQIMVEWGQIGAGRLEVEF